MTVKVVEHNALSKMLAMLTKPQRQEVLEELIETPGFTVEDELLDEIFNITGSYQKLFKTVERIDKIGSDLPQALQGVWDKYKEQAANDKVDILAEMEAFQRRFEKMADARLESIGQLARKATKKTEGVQSQKFTVISVAAGFGAGAIAMTALSYSVFFPQQLAIVRAGDRPIIEWLSTIDGKLMKRSFDSGNTSIKSCLAKGGLNKNKKPICQIELK
jgi:hypothetical protein